MSGAGSAGREGTLSEQEAAGGVPGTGEAAVAVLLGAGALAWRLADRVTAPARWMVGGVAGGMLAAVVRPLAVGPTAAAGRALQERWADLVGRAVAHVAREVVAVVLPALDLTTLVLAHVDLDRIAAALDLDAAVGRVDIEAIVDRIDLDALAARIDVEAIVDRVDLDAAVARVDLDAVVDRIDIEAIAARLDLDRLAAGLDVAAIVDRVDLDAAVARVDTDRIVARVDLDAIVARLDLVGIAQTVIDAIDLHEIVRESTGALSSDAVRAVRVETRRADDRVAGMFDRLLRRNQYGPDGPPAGAPALP
jgi:hypothetical protein